MKLKAIVEIELDMENEETFEQANDRLRNLLFDGLCRYAPCEFWVHAANEVED